MATHKDRILFQVGKEIEGYTVKCLLGQGGFGDVYRVIDSSKRSYAMKTEYHDAPKRALKIEIDVMQKLKGKCFPKVYKSGETDECKYLVMGMYGPSLSDICRAHMNCLTETVMYSFSVQMLNVIEEFHKVGFVHRDIKPSNFLIQRNQKVPLVIIDFGLSKPYCNFETREVLPPSNGHYVGTKKYASLNSHLKKDLGRRDDLYSWFYSMLEMMKGRLPWRNMKELDDVALCKRNEIDKLLRPFNALQKINTYLNTLEFEDEPNYDFLRQILISEMNYKRIYVAEFDWIKFYKEENKNKDDDDEENEDESEESSESSTSDESSDSDSDSDSSSSSSSSQSSDEKESSKTDSKDNAKANEKKKNEKTSNTGKRSSLRKSTSKKPENEKHKKESKEKGSEEEKKGKEHIVKNDQKDDHEVNESKSEHDRKGERKKGKKKNKKHKKDGKKGHRHRDSEDSLSEEGGCCLIY
ncbi:CK1 family protein kinase [Tritrichomonas foetus]|uniref:non-specific serine/threonine protein kinase n=1 Tax=Tritrichomonas foetus TaxID=1144522 RepID=A0A1J4J588_9EUKA|nr:CK1 family protein kinase [Tritrichomonas foetus]|eukprot:OHS94440.1 CK1 family protein kinase [Tritrichomonas foetus]